ncbi:hypothetical protein QAD02_016787 [Eretmocerus hayati]|uniref:Uncharacterized protein n=1 Tax=Eretmocerus hayati TaxID=131215 RepID=A0ACC2PGW1_9HYME|nr:hypothetical protein QAD02_016787 [Eretmocerus hayati]
MKLVLLTSIFLLGAIGKTQGSSCWTRYILAGEYPYLAMVIPDCEKYFSQATSIAAIVSPNFVLGLYTNPGIKCKYTVRIGADDQGKDGIMSNVEKVIIHEVLKNDSNPTHQLVLYKLTEPIQTDPWIDSIQVPQERPKTGDAGVVVGFRNGDRKGYGSKVFRMKRNVTSEEDWRALNDGLPVEKQRSIPKGSLATVYLSDGCPRVQTSILVVNRQLAGFMDKRGRMTINGTKFEADGFVDVAYYKDWIENNIQTPSAASQIDHSS